MTSTRLFSTRPGLNKTWSQRDLVSIRLTTTDQVRFQRPEKVAASSWGRDNLVIDLPWLLALEGAIPRIPLWPLRVWVLRLSYLWFSNARHPQLQDFRLRWPAAAELRRAVCGPKVSGLMLDLKASAATEEAAGDRRASRAHGGATSKTGWPRHSISFQSGP
jgi:hypothetical protein